MEPQSLPRTDGLDPFKFVCPGCGADSDSEDQEFQLLSFAFVPHTEYLLFEIHCVTCDLTTGFGIYPLSQREYLASFTDGTPPEASVTGERALLDRYSALVDMYRQQWEEACNDGQDRHEIDMSALEPQLFDPNRYVTVPVQALAVARGWRRAVAAYPDLPPRGYLLIGHFSFVLSLDKTPHRMMPYSLHLSVMNTFTPGKLSKTETAFALSLFFTPGEWPFLSREEGRVRPVTHLYLGAESPKLNEC